MTPLAGTLAALDWSLLGPAFLAGLLVLATHVPLGREVLGRGIVFLDLAIAQVAGLGVVAASGFGAEDDPVSALLAAIVAALLGAAFLQWTERRWPKAQEATIGVTFVVAACLAILAVSRDPHGGEHLQDILAGQILWTGWPDLAGLAAVAALTLLVGLRRQQSPFLFYALFALVVTASVRVVGVYLVFASLIVPALLGGRAGVAAWIGGVAGYAVGLAASLLLDLPAGPAIVCALPLTCAMAGMFGRQRAG